MILIKLFYGYKVFYVLHFDIYQITMATINS